jgi:hypothetical protein
VRRIRNLAVVLCALSGSCATAPRAPDEGGNPWVRAEGEHLVVETDLGATVAPTFVRELENARSAMAAALLPDARPPRQPLEVVVIGARELGAMHYQLAGVYSDRRFVGPALIVSDEDRWKRRSVMRHELAHAVIAENLHGVPQWLNEGLAVLLATADVDQRSGEVTWGGVLSAEDASAGVGGGYLTTIERLLDLKPWSSGEMGRFELSAGLLVRMLEDKHPVEFQCLLRRLSRFEPYAEALENCFPDRGSWGRQYSRGEDQAARDIGKTHIRPYGGAVEVSPMPDADVHAVLALVNLVVAGTNQDEEQHAALLESSKRHRRHALALDATQILAASLELASEHGDKAVDPCAQARLAARLVEENPDDWRAWFWRGHVGCVPIEEIEAAHERAWKLAPYRPEVLASRADDACRKKDWKACEAIAQQGRLTGDLELAFGGLLFEALEQQGRCDEARRLLTRSAALEKSVNAEIGARDSQLNADRTIHCVDPPTAATSPLPPSP